MTEYLLPEGKYDPAKTIMRLPVGVTPEGKIITAPFYQEIESSQDFERGAFIATVRLVPLSESND